VREERIVQPIVEGQLAPLRSTVEQLLRSTEDAKPPHDRRTPSSHFVLDTPERISQTAAG
jgi:hypothetical protein